VTERARGRGFFRMKRKKGGLLDQRGVGGGWGLGRRGGVVSGQPVFGWMGGEKGWTDDFGYVKSAINFGKRGGKHIGGRLRWEKIGKMFGWAGIWYKKKRGQGVL